MDTLDGPVWAIVLAGGAGRRFGSPKQFAAAGGRLLVDLAVDAVAPVCDGVVVVVPSGDTYARPGMTVVAGGPSRPASVRCGLAAVPGAAAFVVVHDAVHPLASAALVTAVLAAVRGEASVAVPVVPAVETPVMVAAGRVDRVLPKAGLAAVQMPQAFRAAVLRYLHVGPAADTDDAALAHAAGIAVATVTGERANLHVVDPEDLAVVEAVLARRRAGGAA